MTLPLEYILFQAYTFKKLATPFRSERVETRKTSHRLSVYRRFISCMQQRDGISGYGDTGTRVIAVKDRPLTGDRNSSAARGPQLVKGSRAKNNLYLVPREMIRQGLSISGHGLLDYKSFWLATQATNRSLASLLQRSLPTEGAAEEVEEARRTMSSKMASDGCPH